jgi:hypothetical protein
MEIIKNQTIYQCSFCGKRLLSRNGCKIHEKKYCNRWYSPNKINLRKKQEDCPHNNCETAYSYIPGEAVQEPDYGYCLDCGLKF